MNVAVITGAASGIGLALTEVYLSQGVLVVMVDKDESKLRDEGLRCAARYPEQVLALSCDVTDAAAVKALARTVVEHTGRVDWLYNNAGIIGELGPVWALSPHAVENVMAVNVYGMLHLIQAFMPYLFEQPTRSHVVNMASLYSVCSSSHTAAYAMSKHAVLALTESLYFDLQRLHKPVDVSIVLPSFTDTGLLQPATPQSLSPMQHGLQNLLRHAKGALEVATHVVERVAQKQFYILPDREVKGYCSERNHAIIMQEMPHPHAVEKLMRSIIKRSQQEF